MNTEFLKTKGATAVSRVLGVSRQTIINYINGKGCMSVDQAMMLARHYGVSLSAVVDPNYREANQDDLLTALDAENRLLHTKLNAIRAMLQNTCNNVEGLIGNLETVTKQEE